MSEAVVTGIGFFTAAGETGGEIESVLSSGRSAVTDLPGADYSTMPLSRGAAIDRSRLAKYGLDPIRLKGFGDYVRFGLAASANALRDAGYAEKSPGRFDLSACPEALRGAFVSTGVNGLNAEALFEAFSMSPPAGELPGPDLAGYASAGIDAVHPKWILTAISNNLIYFVTSDFGLRGENNNTALSSTGGCFMLDAAREAVSSGRCKMALVVGSDSLVNWQMIDDLSRLGLLNDRKRDGEASGMSPFSPAARGALPGEGAACLVVEERDFASARGARIYARVSRTVQCCDNSSASEPSRRASAFRAVASELFAAASGRPGGHKMLVNLDGASVPSWDASELEGVSAALSSSPAFAGSGGARFSSSKRYFGHTFSASFVIDAAVSLLAMDRGFSFPLGEGDGTSISSAAAGTSISSAAAGTSISSAAAGTSTSSAAAGSIVLASGFEKFGHRAAITLSQCFGGNVGGALFEKL